MGIDNNYLHVIKILHEVSHMLTPGFMTRKSSCSINEIPNDIQHTTPVHIGKINGNLGDTGTGWEDVY